MASIPFSPIIVTTTSDDQEVLNGISKQLIAMRLAACVQISGPITSCYHWQGAIESSTEWQCLAKTSQHLFPELEKVVLDLHNYDQPQLVTWKITDGNSGYLAWLEANLK